MEDMHKSSLIMILLAVVFVMAIGYAAFSTTLNINGTAQITSSWDVHIEDIAIKNGGTLDAKLESITFVDSDNEAIVASYSGISQNDVIEAGRTQTFTITVKFNESYTYTPEVTTGSVTMNLTYVQA